MGADRLGQGLAERLTLGRVGTVVQVGGGGLLCFLWGSGECSERAWWACGPRLAALPGAPAGLLSIGSILSSLHLLLVGHSR